MSRWGKPIKNKKHRDPRYFLNENLGLEEAAPNVVVLPEGILASPLAFVNSLCAMENITSEMLIALANQAIDDPGGAVGLVLGFLNNAGIALPAGAGTAELDRLVQLIMKFEIELPFLGRVSVQKAMQNPIMKPAIRALVPAAVQTACSASRQLKEQAVGLTARDKLPRPEEHDEMDYMSRLDRSAGAAKTPHERFADTVAGMGHGGEFVYEPPMGPYTDAGAQEAGGRIERGQDPADGTAGPIKRAVETPRYLRALADAALDKNRSEKGRQTALSRLSARAEQSGQSGANAKALLDAVLAGLHKQKMKSRGGLSEPSPGETAVDALDESAFDVLAAGRRALKRHLRAK